VAAVNRHLCAQPVIREGGGFITLLFGKLNPRTHELEWTSAGHPVPLLHCRATDAFTPLGTRDDGGLALGIMDDAEYTSITSRIPPESRVLLYTDGLEEAFPSGQDRCQQFGYDGITRTLRKFRTGLVEDALQGLFAASNAHTEGAGRHDDTTVVMIDRV
ncbi:MAG: serine/threonine-protein phosphatase, partial [Planctomycetia bacterium]|nr:serine/threonine-protein phosphatase [Planctomycetia bacterium]